MWDRPERAEDDDAVETERWCAGLVSVGAAPIEPEERSQLTRWSRAMAATGLLTGLAALALAAWPFVLPERFWARADATAALATAAVLLSWVLALPVAGLIGVDLVRRYLAHVRELLGDEVEVFEGTLDGARLDPEQRRLLKAQAFVATPAGAQRLRVFPRSLTVRLPMSHGRARWGAVRVRTVAAGPAYEMRVTIPRESIGVSDPRVEILRRRMTPDERREVLLRAGRLRSAWKALLLQGLIGLIVYAAIFRTLAAHAWVAIVAAVGLAAWSAQRARRPVDALLLAGKLRRDADAGLVLTHRRRARRNGTPPDAAVDPHDASWVDIEFLPVSSLSWTVRGRPARWRDLMAPAWRLPWMRV